MKILFIGNTASVPNNLVKELRTRTGVARVDFVFNKNPCLSGEPTVDSELLSPGDYDIVHLDYCFLFSKLNIKYIKYIVNAKNLVCNWHGSDIRGLDMGWYKQLFYKPLKWFSDAYMFRNAKFHLYSTCDLAWWFRKVSVTKKDRFIQTIDTELFNPNINVKRDGEYIFKGGSRGYNRQKVKHDDMPKFLNTFESVICIPAEGLSPYLINSTVLEALACGCRVKYHPLKNRAWVLKYARIDKGVDKLIRIYNRILKS